MWQGQEKLKEIYERQGPRTYNRTYKVVCPVCGDVVYTTSNRMKYCSDKCSRYAYAKRLKERKRLAKLKVCLSCGCSFQAKRANAKYCCAACRQKAYRKRITGKTIDNAVRSINRNEYN